MNDEKRKDEDLRKLIEQEKAAEKAGNNLRGKQPESQEGSDKEVPWGTREAWWGVLALLGIFIVFIFIAGLVASVVSLPSPAVLGVLTASLYGAIFWVVYYFSGYQFGALAFKSTPFFKASAYVIGSFIAVIIFETLWLALLNLIGVIPPDSAEGIVLQFGTSIFGLIVIFLVTVMIAPLVEEIFFRSFLYQAFRKKYGITLGILISALFFAVFHFSFIAILPVFFVIGVFLAYVFEKFHSIYPSIMLHALNNFIFFIALVLAVT